MTRISSIPTYRGAESVVILEISQQECKSNHDLDEISLQSIDADVISASMLILYVNIIRCHLRFFQLFCCCYYMNSLGAVQAFVEELCIFCASMFTHVFFAA